MGRGLVWAGAFIALVAAGSVYAQDEVLNVDPFEDLVDLYRLTHPMTGHTGQTGSYDRTGGNGDASFWYYLRGNPRRAVMADVRGPGVISRIWVTAFDPNVARIEIFIDGSATPVVSAYMRDFFGNLPPFTPPLSTPSTGSWISYVPIPFERSCRIEAIDARADDNIIYYNVTYRQFSSGSAIAEPFQMPPTANQQADLNTFAQQWSARSQDPKPPTVGEQVISSAHFILRGQKATLANLPGAGVITGIRLSVDHDNAGTLPDTRIRARWDGNSTYAIDAATGSFFGSTFARANAEGLPLGTKDGHAYCYLPMPYANGAVIEVENTAPFDVYIGEARITYVPMNPAEVGRMRFHTQYKEQTIFGGMPSYRILDTTGRGHYLGCTMSIRAGDPNWGILEGDEQIYVNGEPTASILGTGTEDYFNGGFYFSGGTVSLPFHGLPSLDNNTLVLSAYRLQVPDPVVFRNGCVVDIEHGGQNEANGHYRSTAYYYRDDASGETPPEPNNPPLDAEPIVNGDYEAGFGGYNDGEANGWIAYQSRAYYGRTPPMFSPATDHVTTGTRSQKITYPSTGPSGFQSVGIAQQVCVAKGSMYEVTAHFRVNLTGSLEPSDVIARLGLGPSGNTYFEDPAVVWTDAPVAADIWHTVTATVTAQNDYLTVFVGGLHKSPSTSGIATIWIDDTRFTNQPVPVPGDLDHDGDVDQADFGRFQACYSGPGIEQPNLACRYALLDTDDDVDQADFSIFQACMSGANVPAEPGCAD